MSVDTQGIEWEVRWIAWGRGRYHLQVVGEDKTVCCREIPFNTEAIRGKVHNGLTCAFCSTGRYEDLRQKADEYQRNLLAFANAQRREQMEANRAGVFKVWRCKKCGLQHQRPSNAGVPFCLTEGHVADLEEVIARGPGLGETDD